MIGGASAAVTTSDCVYHGLSVAETGAATAEIKVRVGGSSGDIIEHIKLTAGQCVQVDRHGGVYCRGGIYYEKTSGTFDGSIFFG